MHIKDNPVVQVPLQRLSQIASELQEGIMRTRMQPIGNLFAKFPRLIRDLSKQLNKQIELEVSGKETEMDRSLLEGLRDPFTHILRNACDHGLERPDIRAAAGKPIVGTLAIRAFHEGGQVIVEIIDDGAGIDPERIKAKAVAQGVITAAEAARMGDNEAISLICHAGLSTAEQVTSISGRGVGMDVVKKNIERMGGSLEILSVIGKGSTFRLKIPLTLAIIPALMVRVGDGLYGIPQLNLVELVGFEASDAAHRIENVRGAEVYRLRERLLTLVRLDRLLGSGGGRRGGGRVRH
jgi:two-component system chemotaxis sensor kinase CheA